LIIGSIPDRVAPAARATLTVRPPWTMVSSLVRL